MILNKVTKPTFKTITLTELKSINHLKSHDFKL